MNGELSSYEMNMQYAIDNAGQIGRQYKTGFVAIRQGRVVAHDSTTDVRLVARFGNDSDTLVVPVFERAGRSPVEIADRIGNME